MSTSLTIGVLALQGAFVEHISLLQRAAAALAQADPPLLAETSLHFIEVRTPAELAACTALILPGGESTAISLIAERGGLLEPLRDAVASRDREVHRVAADHYGNPAPGAERRRDHVAPLISRWLRELR